MKTDYPKCIDKCSECLYYKVGKCIAMAGDDFFTPYKEQLTKSQLSKLEGTQDNFSFIDTQFID